MKHKLESKLPGEISITSDMQMISRYGRKQRTKEPLDESERGEWESRLKTQHSKNKEHGIWSHHFMGTRWGNNGNSEGLFWGVPKPMQMVTAAMKLKDTCLLLVRKVMNNLDSIWKSRDMTLPTKVRVVEAVVFPVVTYGCESWTIKKAEHQRIDAFEL